MSQGELLTEADLRAEVKRLRHEVSQKQKRENKLEGLVAVLRRRTHRLHVEMDAGRAALRLLGFHRTELAELGRELLRVFGGES